VCSVAALSCAGRPLVNFDVALGDLLREARWLGRLGCEVPEPARRVLLQEHKLKFYHARLAHLLRARVPRVTPARPPLRVRKPLPPAPRARARRS
jgi:hypothetical protein